MNPPFPSAIKNCAAIPARLSPEEAAYIDRMSIADLEAIRLVLSGNSVVDWFRLDFRDDAQIEEFLRVNGYDISQAQDRRRLERISREAAGYIDRHFPHRLPEDFLEGMSISRLLYTASQSSGRTKDQIYACMMLKVMHTINHIDARELFHRCEMKAVELFAAVENKVGKAVTTMQLEGFHIVDFYGSHKEKESLITKLIAKKESHAALVYDRIRFRIITNTLADLLPVIYFLGRTICPFNYVIPGHSHNNLISFTDLLAWFPQFRHYRGYLVARQEGLPTTYESGNHFSGSKYRSVNFVADIPIRIDDYLYTPDFADLGRIIFVPVEFQIMDLGTYQRNEQGENNHQNYKRRQMEAVNRRLGIHLAEE